MMKIIKSLALIAFSVLVSCATNPSDLMPGQRELQLLRKNAHEREECFRDLNRDSVLRRTAFRLLINTEELSSSILEAGLTDSDPEIRQYAIYETFCRKGADALAALEAAIA